jgi:antitoxin (DNA-binding transcriptional repressor) of toxin-antitoxin stability system
MVQVTVEQAVSELGRLLEEVSRGEEFVIVQGDAPLARLLPARSPRQPGSAIGIITYVAEDFDAPLEDFKAADYEGVNALAVGH